MVSATEAEASMLSLRGHRDLLDALQEELSARGGLAPLWAGELAKELSEGDDRVDQR